MNHIIYHVGKLNDMYEDLSPEDTDKVPVILRKLIEDLIEAYQTPDN